MMLAANNAKKILNGVVGDHLEATGNELAIEMAFYSRNDGSSRPLNLSRLKKEAAAARIDEQQQQQQQQFHPKLCILVHGLVDDESTWSYRNGSGGGDGGGRCDDDYGRLLQKDFGGDISPLYLRYNTGLHISTNGQKLSRLMEQLLQSYPIDIQEITFLCHSMGGLVTRSACLYASLEEHQTSSWVRRVARVVFLGTPHLGSYWEKFGNVLSNALGSVPRPYMKLAAQVGNLRSAGIKDLRFGYVHHEDWQGDDDVEDMDVDAFLVNTKKKRDAELLDWVSYYIVTGTVTKNPSHLVSLCLGDGLVRKPSAEGRSDVEEHHLTIPPEHIREFPGVSHCRLAKDPAVYEQIKKWITIEQQQQQQQQPSEAAAPATEWEAEQNGGGTVMDDDDDDDDDDIDEAAANSAEFRRQTAGKWAQWKGVTTLVQTTVGAGATAVEGVQHELTNEVYSLLSKITPIAPAVKRIHAVHEATVHGVYDAVRTVNYGTGEVVKCVLNEMDKKERTGTEAGTTT